MYSGFQMFVAFMLGGFTSVTIILVWLVCSLLKLLFKTLIDSIDTLE